MARRRPVHPTESLPVLNTYSSASNVSYSIHTDKNDTDSRFTITKIYSIFVCLFVVFELIVLGGKVSRGRREVEVELVPESLSQASSRRRYYHRPVPLPSRAGRVLLTRRHSFSGI
jgi:hypothetical protein